MTINLSTAFTAYLLAYRPYLNSFDNNIQIFNELAFTIITFHQLGFTDLNRDAATKNILGWSMVFISFTTLMFPNLFLMVRSMVQDIYNAYKKNEERKRIAAWGEYLNNCEIRRLAFIEKYNLELKDEFKPNSAKLAPDTTSKNQILPFFEKDRYFDTRVKNKEVKRTLKHLDPDIHDKVDCNPQMSRISEQKSEQEAFSFQESMFFKSASNIDIGATV